ncbi:MAG: glycosyltransferase family 4 protein [Bacteroidota bacterium]
MNKKDRILFFGELPVDSFHGISIANQINLKMLESVFDIDIINEETILKSHNKVSLSKIGSLLICLFIISYKSLIHRYIYFYMVFSTSFFGSIKTLFAIIAFRLFNRGKVVLHIHRGDFFSRFYLSKYKRLLADVIFYLSKKNIVLSETQKNEFEKHFHKSFFVLSNTIEIEMDSALIPRTNINFIFISNYFVDKGIVDLLIVFEKIVKKYKHVTLNTYGEFADRKLRTTVYGFKSANIVINGPIKGKDKFVTMANSSGLILPSWNEGQPLVLLEAMSVGTPVIASKVGLIPEILGEDYPFMTTPADRNSLEAAILEFLNCKSLESISNQLKSRYNAEYSQKRHCEQLFRIFL